MSAIPCPTCPWRKSSTVGGSDIPNFDLDLMRSLSNTVGPTDDFRPVMACHYSKCDAETACVGYVAVEGWHNLVVRLMAAEGKLNIAEIMEATKNLDLWANFDEMLAAYVEAS